MLRMVELETCQGLVPGWDTPLLLDLILTEDRSEICCNRSDPRPRIMQQQQQTMKSAPPACVSTCRRVTPSHLNDFII